MKNIRNNAYDPSTWVQVSSKIRNADEYKRTENKNFIDKVNSIIEKNTVVAGKKK